MSNVAYTLSLQRNNFYRTIGNIKRSRLILPGLLFYATIQIASAQSPSVTAQVPDWALPGSATHQQVPPPADFHRATRTKIIQIGIFDGQSDVGAALTPGSGSYDPATNEYTITAAGYNVWYTRDEFSYLWKKMSGDISLAINVSFPDTAGVADRKAIIIIRQSLDDDSKEAMVALHGGGLLHLAWRPEKGENIKEMRVDIQSLTGIKSLDPKALIHAQRIGIEKHGDDFALFVSMTGEPMHQYGKPIHLRLNGPFYVGIGFSSHHPVNEATTIISNVVLANAAGKVN